MGNSLLGNVQNSKGKVGSETCNEELKLEKVRNSKINKKLTKAGVTTTIRLRFDYVSTAVELSFDCNRPRYHQSSTYDIRPRPTCGDCGTEAAYINRSA